MEDFSKAVKHERMMDDEEDDERQEMKEHDAPTAATTTTMTSEEEALAAAEAAVPPIENKVYPYVQELVPPTGVTLSGYGRITGPLDHNLVIVRTSLIQIYSIHEGRAMTLVYEKKLFGVVQDMGVLRHPQTLETDLLILTFVDAKASVLRYDAEANELQVVSMHCFERRPPSSDAPDPKLGCTQFVKGPWVRVESNGKCAAVLVYDRNMGIIAFDYPPPEQSSLRFSGSLGLGDLLLGTSASSSSSSSSLAAQASSSHGDAEKEQEQEQKCVVEARSHLIPLMGVGNVLDFGFGFEREPILYVLYRKEYTWAGRTEKLRYTNGLRKVLLMQGSKEKLVFDIDELPYNSDTIVPLKSPLNGVLVLSPNTVLYCDQTVRFCLVLNEYGIDDASDRKWTTERSRERIVLDGPRNFAMLADDRIMLTNRDGTVFFLTIHHEGQDVRSLSISKLRPDSQQQQQQKPRWWCPEFVPVSTLCVIPDLEMCFFGSKFATSSLVSYRETNFDSLSSSTSSGRISSTTATATITSTTSSKSNESASANKRAVMTDKELNDEFDSIFDGLDSLGEKKEPEEPTKKKAKIEDENNENESSAAATVATTTGEIDRHNNGDGNDDNDEPQSAIPPPFAFKLVERMASVGVIRDFVVSDTLITSKMRERDAGCGTYDIIACTGRGEHGSSLVALENYVRLKLDMDVEDMRGYSHIHFVQLGAGSVLLVGSGKGRGMAIQINERFAGNKVDGVLGKEATIFVGNVSDSAFVRIHDGGFSVFSCGLKVIGSHEAEAHAKVATGCACNGFVATVLNSGVCRVFSVDASGKRIEEAFAVGNDKSHAVAWATLFDDATGRVFLGVLFKTGCLKVFCISGREGSKSKCVFGCRTVGNVPSVISSSPLVCGGEEEEEKDTESNTKTKEEEKEGRGGEEKQRAKPSVVIREAFFARFENGSMDLIIVLSSGEVVAYKGRKTPLANNQKEEKKEEENKSSDSDGITEPDFPYTFFKVSSNTFCGGEGLGDTGDGTYVPRVSMLTNRRGVCVSGRRPLFVSEESGYPRVLPLGLGDAGVPLSVAPFRLGEGHVGLAVLSARTQLKVYTVPHISTTRQNPGRGVFGGWVAQRIRLDKPLAGAPTQVVYVDSRKLHVVATAEPAEVDGRTMIPRNIKRKSESSKAGEAGAAAEAMQDFSFVTQKERLSTVRGVLRLVKVSGAEGKVLNEVRLEPNEIVYSMICYRLERVGRQVVVVGTGILENENVHCVGRLLIYEIAIPPEEEKDDDDDGDDDNDDDNNNIDEEVAGAADQQQQHSRRHSHSRHQQDAHQDKEEDEKWVLKEVLANKYLGPITSLHVVEGKLLVATPPIICLYTVESPYYSLLPENFQYVYNACTAMGVATFKSLKTVIFLGDSERNISVLRMASLRRFRPLCKDNRPLCAQAAIVLTDRERENFCYVVADIDGNCHVLSITNKGEEARKLQERPLGPDEPVLYPEEKAFRVIRNARTNLQAHVSQFHRLLGHAAAFGTMEGGISAIALLPADDYRCLTALQEAARSAAPFTAGLNPRQYRAVKTPTTHYAVNALENFHPVLPKEVTLNSFADGDLLGVHFLSLPLDVQQQAAEKAGVALTDAHRVIQKTEGIFGCFIAKFKDK